MQARADSLTLAFYKGRARTLNHRLQELAIRWRTRPDRWSFKLATYSHVEMIAGTARLGAVHECYSSSGRFGGVRCADILLKPDHWDLVELPLGAADPIAFIAAKIGAKYDYTAIFLTHAVSLSIHRADRWTCSEICAAAIGFKHPHLISPQMLFEICTAGNSRR